MERIETPVTPQSLLNVRAFIAVTDFAADLLKRELRMVAGREAMHLAYSGRGTSYGVDGRGQQHPVQHWVAIPREKDIVHLILVTPEDNSESSEAVFEAMLKTLEVSDT